MVCVWVCLCFFSFFFWVIQSANIVDWCFRCFRAFRCLFWKGGWDGRIQYWLGSSAVILAHDSMKGLNAGQVQLKGSPRLKTGWWGLPNKLDDFFPLSMYTSQCYVLGNFMQIRIPCLFHVFPNQPPKKTCSPGWIVCSSRMCHRFCSSRMAFLTPALCPAEWTKPSSRSSSDCTWLPIETMNWWAGKVVVFWSQTPPKNGTRLMMWNRCTLYSVLCLNSIFTTLHTIALVDS